MRSWLASCILFLLPGLLGGCGSSPTLSSDGSTRSHEMHSSCVLDHVWAEELQLVMIRLDAIEAMLARLDNRKSDDLVEAHSPRSQATARTLLPPPRIDGRADSGIRPLATVRVPGNASRYYDSATTHSDARAFTYSENGSYYGERNANGVPKTVRVEGYFRKDGTYVRGHYRSRPGSNR